MLRHLNWKHASGAVLFSASATLLAQQSVPTPGQVGDTLKPPAALEKPATAEIDQQPTEAASPPAAADGAVTITVSGFEWSGNTRYSNDELNAVVRAFVGKPLDILGIYEAADAVTAHYVDAGYTLASVKVPAQKVGSGVVKLEVIEGLVSSVAVQGQQRYREKFLAAHLADIQPEAVYEGTTLEQDLYVLNELPGLSSRAVLKPGAQFGTSDIVVEVTEDPFEFQTTVDNYGRESTGEFRASINGAVNNPLTLADQFSYMLLVSDKALLKYAFAEYSVPINTMGSRLALSYGHADFEVDEDVFDGIEGKNSQIRMKLGHPVLRGRQSRIDAYTAVSHTDADSDLFGTTLPRETDLLLLEVGGSVVHR